MLLTKLLLGLLAGLILAVAFGWGYPFVARGMDVLSHTVNGKAGESFLYNPPFYSWASRPMAEVTGVPFSTLVERYVFLPAGMTRSARIHRNLPLRADLAEEVTL